MISEVHNEDCMVGMARYPDKFFELAIVDPPYGIETRGNAQDRFNMGHDLSMVNDQKPTGEYFRELFRVSKNQIIWGYNHLSDMLPSCREFIFWYKHQPVVTFSDGELAWTSFQKTARCFDYPYYKANLSNGDKIHPVQKPIELYKWLLKNYATCSKCLGSGEAESLSIDCDVQTCGKCKGNTAKILDTHLGSGSSRIAAYDLGFDFYGWELDKDYYEAQEKRFRQFKSQGKLFSAAA